MNHERRTFEFYVLAAFFLVFVLFLYGPLSAILILSFQGPDGGLTFPLNGVSVHWFFNLFEKQAVGDFGASFRRSFTLGLMVMVVTVVVSLLAGLAFRRRFRGCDRALLSRRSPASSCPRSSSRSASAWCSSRRPEACLVLLRLRRASDLDAALRRADHVCRLQPLLAGL